MEFEDFMTLEVDTLLNEDFEKGRKLADVGVIEGMIESEKARFFLKRTYHEPLGKILRQVLLLRNPHYNTAREAIAIRQLNDCGFATTIAVASGEWKRSGIPVASFLLIKEVRGRQLAGNFRELPGATRARIMRAYGELLAGLHDSGFFHRVKLNDLFDTGEGAGPVNLVLIDRDARAPYPKSCSRKRLALRNTASNLRLVMKSYPMTTREGRSFLSGYKARSKLFRDRSKAEWYRMVKRKYLGMISRPARG